MKFTEKLRSQECPWLGHFWLWRQNHWLAVIISYPSKSWLINQTNIGVIFQQYNNIGINQVTCPIGVYMMFLFWFGSFILTFLKSGRQSENHQITSKSQNHDFMIWFHYREVKDDRKQLQQVFRCISSYRQVLIKISC